MDIANWFRGLFASEKPKSDWKYDHQQSEINWDARRKERLSNLYLQKERLGAQFGIGAWHTFPKSEDKYQDILSKAFPPEPSYNNWKFELIEDGRFWIHTHDNGDFLLNRSDFLGQKENGGAYWFLDQPALPIAEDGRYVVIGLSCHSALGADFIGVWDLENEGLARLIQGPGPLQSIVVSPDSHWIAAAFSINLLSYGEEDSAYLFDFKTGEQRAIFAHPEISQVRFSPDSKQLATSDQIDTVIVWEIPQKKK